MASAIWVDWIYVSKLSEIPIYLEDKRSMAWVQAVSEFPIITTTAKKLFYQNNCPGETFSAICHKIHFLIWNF